MKQEKQKAKKNGSAASEPTWPPQDYESVAYACMRNVQTHTEQHMHHWGHYGCEVAQS